MKIRFYLLPLLAAALFTACTPDGDNLSLSTVEADITPEGFLVDEGEDGHVDYPDYDFVQAIQDHVDGHAVNADAVRNAEDVTVTRPDGTTEELIRVGGCIDMTKAEFLEFEAVNASLEKQYRTSNLVSIGTVRVIGYTGGGGYGLTSRMRTALQWAVNNYNALNINKTFTLSFSSSTSADIVVYRQPNNSGAGGSAGFPSGGRPNKFVQIYRGMDNYDTNTIEHVMTHEIGHSMGLRHTDYTTRQSCGQNTNEGSAGVGAILIPGTPSGYDPNSIMLSCFSSGEDGEFGFYDRVALEAIY